jgi:hypothetical protein
MTKRPERLSAVDNKSAKPDKLSTTISAACDVLTDESLTAEARAMRILNRISDTTFPTPEARIAMAGEVKSFIENAKGLRLNCDPKGLLVESARLGQRATELARPIADTAAHVPRDVNDLPDVCGRGLASSGWSGQEIDWLVIRLMQTKQILGAWDSHGVTTVAGVRITRLDLREGAAPRNELREKFLQSLPRIPSEEQTEVKET